MEFRWISNNFDEKAWLDFKLLSDSGGPWQSPHRIRESECRWSPHPRRCALEAKPCNEHITSFVVQSVVRCCRCCRRTVLLSRVCFTYDALVHLIEFKSDRGMEIAWDSKISNNSSAPFQLPTSHIFYRIALHAYVLKGQGSARFLIILFYFPWEANGKPWARSTMLHTTWNCSNGNATWPTAMLLRQIKSKNIQKPKPPRHGVQENKKPKTSQNSGQCIQSCRVWIQIFKGHASNQALHSWNFATL